MTVPATAPALRRPDGSALRVLVVDDEQMHTDQLSIEVGIEGGQETRPNPSECPGMVNVSGLGPEMCCNTWESEAIDRLRWAERAVMLRE